LDIKKSELLSKSLSSTENGTLLPDDVENENTIEEE